MHSIQVLLFILTYSSVCIGCFHCCNCGALNVTYPYLFIGEYLNMACTLTQETADAGDDSSKLYFTYGNDIEVPKNETTMINSTTLVMSKLMSSLAYDGFYHCKIRDPVNVTNQFVAKAWIELEYPPKKVENFSCIIYDWDESMVCTWDLGVNYHNIRNINTILYIHYGGNPGHYGSCPKMHLTNCTWNRGGDTVFDWDIMKFYVNVNNTKHKSENSQGSGWIRIKQKDNVKPSKADYLLARNNGSTCIYLEWSHSRTGREKAFIISLSSEWNDNQIIKTISVKPYDKNFHETICELMPDTVYNVRIVTVPAFGKGYESDPELNSTRTDRDLPARSPEVSEGGFSTNSESCVKNKRSVTVYWKSIPREYQNGPMLGYHVSMSGSKGYLYNIAVSNPNQLHLSLNLPCNEEIIVSNQAWGKAGNSTTATIITIPKKTDISQPNHIVVEAQKNSTDTLVEVSWKVPDDSPVRSCVVFYCQYDTECINEIQWKDVMGNYSSKVLDHIQFDKKYRFGVSCNGSGFKWQTCYYIKSMEPIPPSTVEVTAYPEKSATVDWSDPLCENSPYIENYLVTWCVADKNTRKCEGDVSNKKIPSLKASSLVISDLKLQRTYGIRVQNEARYENRLSDYSEMQFVQPHTSGLQKDEIIGISFAGLFLFVLAIAGVIFIIRQAAPRIRSINRPLEILNIKIKTDPIHRHPLPSSSLDTCTSSAGDTSSSGKLSNEIIRGKELLTQISKDSGRGSITSESHSPGIENKPGDLIAVEEESCDQNHSKDLRKIFPSNNNKNETPLLDPYYSMVTMEESKEEVLYKSSSDEKMLVNVDENEEDGYNDIGRKCKSLDTVRPVSYPGDTVTSYVRHDTDDVHSIGTNDSSRDFTENGLRPLMPQSNVDDPSQFGKNRELKNNFDPFNDMSVNESDLKSIEPDVVFNPTKQTQDQQTSKLDFLRMNSIENPNLHIPLTPLGEAKDEDSNFSSVNNGYISEENILGQGHSVSNSGQQDTSNSAYISETTAKLLKCNEPTLLGTAVNGGYVTEESLNNDSSTRLEAETSVSGVGRHFENQNKSGYVTGQELLNINNSSGCSKSIGNSGGYVTEKSLDNNKRTELGEEAGFSGDLKHFENQNKSGYVAEQELLNVSNASGNSERIGNSSGRKPLEFDHNNLFSLLNDHEGSLDSECSFQVETPSTSQGSEYVSFDLQNGAVPSTNIHL